MEAPYLKLVPVARSQAEISKLCHNQALEQRTLFPMADSAHMVFLNTADLSGDDFITFLKDVSPSILIDLRTAPRFDYGKVNRRQAFKIFSEQEIKYIDVAGVMEISSKRDANLNPGLLVDFLNAKLTEPLRVLRGPVAFLFDEVESIMSAADVFPKYLNNHDKKKVWELFIK
ncbi:MAG: hypothetical protein LZF86_50152 [Nitrospira sp.]|nr:MAG: hypothetical protein LZF86_50152 [Nitrospira sp.]